MVMLNNSQRTKSKGGICCCGKRSVSPDEEEDRVEHAFRRMDRDNSGFVTWTEFAKVVFTKIDLIDFFFTY